MACEALKARYDALEAQVKQLIAEIAAEPSQDRGPGQSRLKQLSAAAWAAGQAWNRCVAAQHAPTGVLPAHILEIANPVTAATVAQARTALSNILASIGENNTFPVDQSSEWVQPLSPDTEYDDIALAASGWAVNPRVVDGDFPFSHPFQNDLSRPPSPFDYEFSLALDRPATNPSQFDHLLSPGNKPPASSIDGTDERVLDQNYANDAGLNFPLGLLGVEMDSANIPRDFINTVKPFDRVALFGRWIVDTGHSAKTATGQNLPRAEIHPPLLMASASLLDKATTRAVFTSRPFLVADTFTTDQSTIYDDAAGNDGTFLIHMLNEVRKVNETFVGIPLASTQVEAHPKVKSYPFRGVHLMHFQVRPPALTLAQQVQAHYLHVSYNFSVRSGCAVQVLSSAPDTIDVIVVMNQTGYKPPPLPSNQGRTWSQSELANLNSTAGTAYLGAEILSGLLQGVIGIATVELILSKGVLSDAYASNNDVVSLLSRQGAVIDAPATTITANAGIHHNDSQPFPVYGWLEAKWVGITNVLAQ